jgi:Rrf2 family iron-sulfur cluster assembly transcriptional regulator
MITRETDYALRTALYLAKCSGDDVVSTAALAAAMSIPYRFLRKIVSKLVAAGLVESRRGKGGGLSLSSPASQISMLQIIQAVDSGSVLLNRCSESGSGCARAVHCGIQKELATMQQQLNAGLRGVSLEMVAARDEQVC